MDRQWYYTQGTSDKQGPVSETEVKELITSGQLAPSDLVWTDGMAEWVRAGSVPELQGQDMPMVAATAEGLPPKLARWMTFVGVMTIIMGVFQCLSCFGIITGILMIVAGVALMGAKTALVSIPKIDPAMAPFFEKLNSFMAMSGIAYIISIVVTALLFVIYFGVIMAVIAGGTAGFQ